jgi:hypothetical protein
MTNEKLKKTELKKENGIFPTWQILIAGAFFLTAMVLITLHVIKFSSSGLSNDPANWGVFGDYYNVVFSIINTAITGLLTYAVYILQKKRDSSDAHRDLWEQKYLMLQETPSLIFCSHDGQSYRLYNMGKGTANNVIFANHKADSVEIGRPMKAYSIPPNCFLAIETYTRNAHKLYAYYESVSIAGETPRYFLTRCISDQNQQIEDEGLISYLKEQAERQSGMYLIAL